MQFFTGVYAILTYLISYLYKAEHTMSKLMKKASKDVYGKDIRENMYSIGNTFLTKRGSIGSIVSTYETFKCRCFLCFCGSLKK